MSEHEVQGELRRIRVVLDPPRTHRGIVNLHPTDYLDFTVDMTSKFQYEFFYDLVRDRIAMIERWEDGERVASEVG